MFKTQTNEPSYISSNTYSIYCFLRGAFTPYCYKKTRNYLSASNTLLRKSLSSLSLSLFDLQVNKFIQGFFASVKFLCNIFFMMNQNLLDINNIPLNVENNDQEHKAYNIVQLLKKNIIEESSVSDGSQPTNNEHTKMKKSLFATLIKRKQVKRPKVKITKKIETCSTINIETESVSSEQEVAGYQISAESEKYYKPIQASEAKTSSKVRKSKHYNFFQKIIKRSKIEDPLPPCASGGDHDNQHKAGDGDKCDYKVLMHLNHFIPTSYLPKYNVKLINSMNELQNILHNLQYSEEHFTHLLKKYIEDPNFHHQLMQACFEYLSLQTTAKNQTNILANALWKQHIDMSKIREHNLQKKLNFLVKANRALQFQSENMGRHCEKLAARTNLYPKRFLHMRSFGKTYARHLIENNRKLQSKLKALTGVVSDFEEEMLKLQEQKSELEEERRQHKTKIFHLEGVVDRDRSNYELERTAFLTRLNGQNRLIKDGEQASKYLLQELITFERQATELGIIFKRSHLSYSDACLPEIIYQLRDYAGELLGTLISAFGEVTSIAKDVTKLRNTNARLQENLQKSTNELDNLSKKLGKNKDIDVNDLESKCNNLQHELFHLQLKLETREEQNKVLNEEINSKKKSLEEANIRINELSEKNNEIQNQIKELTQLMSQLAPHELDKEFPSNQDKLEHLRLRYTQANTDLKQLNEKCNSLAEENQSLLQNQELYQQDLSALQEAINVLSAENEITKKQLAAEHQTVITLQSERVKYLEEKNILKTIFQHLKGEIGRIQQLEGAVADMTKETNRLALIAEFNKQLGEQLKSEVEIKEHTILELKQSLEKISHLQIDNDKEKFSLCAQLSEVSTAKEKLRDCLEQELKKNMQLDECKKKLESTTKSQIKVYEEMQKNERAALKELLKDFKSLIKQRDALLLLCEENKKKQQDLEKRSHDIKKKHEQAQLQIKDKDEEIAKLTERLEEQDLRLKELEESSHNNDKSYEKTIRKMEKLLGQLRNEKGELESSNNNLKTNLQKIQSDLNESRQKERETINQLGIKSSECATLDSELSTYKNEIQIINQENGKLKTELEYLRKLYDRQNDEFNNILSQFSSKDNMYLETQNTMLNKEQEICQLNKIITDLENKIKQMEHEAMYLRKQNEDQSRIIMNYENQLLMMSEMEASKLKLEKELHNVQMEHKSTLVDLENSRKEIDRLNKELQEQILKLENEKTFYQKQRSELIMDYNQQKANIENEIDNIATQLQKVTDNLHKEKARFDELSKVHDDLKHKFAQIKEKLTEEMNAHQETCRKLEDTDNVMKKLASERDDLQKQIHSLLLGIKDEKDNNIQLSSEVKSLQKLLDQGRQQYGYILSRNASLEEEVKQLRFEIENLSDFKEHTQLEMNTTFAKLEEKMSELKAAKDNIEHLKVELNESQKALIDLKDDYFTLQQKVTGLEFKNCELTLQVHESHAKLETERNLYKELKHLKVQEQDTTQIASSDGCDAFY